MTTWIEDARGNKCSVASLVALTAIPTAECIRWTGHCEASGYGRVWHQKRNTLAHRASYELNIGRIPSGSCVLHRCDNPPCINPAHLFLGSQADNMRDRDNKRRACRGSANGRAKISEHDAKKIRAATGTVRALAAQFGISAARISDIRNGKTWRHI